MISVTGTGNVGDSRIRIEGMADVVVNEWANLTRELICLLVKDFGEESVKEELKRIFEEARRDGIKQVREEKAGDEEN